MDEFDLLEIRPGRFVRLDNGKVSRSATPGEIYIHKLRSKLPHIDIGSIEVCLALSAISALIINAETIKLIRNTAAFAFFLSLFSAYLTGGTYVILRVPIAISEFQGTFQTRKNLAMATWIFLLWPIRLLKFALVPSYNPGIPGDSGLGFIVECGYIMLFWGLLLTGAAAAGYIVWLLT